MASLAAAASVLGSGEAEAEPAGGNLTVHVLDLYSGTPASGVKVDLFMREGQQMTAVKSVVTDADGRSGPLLAGDAFAAGRYLLAFDCRIISRSPTRPCRRISSANCRWSSRSPTRTCRTTYRCNARRGRRPARCCRADGKLTSSPHCCPPIVCLWLIGGLCITLARSLQEALESASRGVVCCVRDWASGRQCCSQSSWLHSIHWAVPAHDYEPVDGCGPEGLQA